MNTFVSTSTASDKYEDFLSIKKKPGSIVINLLLHSFQVKIANQSSQFPITVNDEVIEKKILKSGDIINVLGNKMRWESKSDARRK